MRRILALAGILGLALVGTSAPANADPAGKVLLCHATGSETNPSVTIEISENGLNGHEGHADDIIPATESGCPGPVTPPQKITICHATGSATNPFVEITINYNGLHGHEGHAGDIIPAAAGGCQGTVVPPAVPPVVTPGVPPVTPQAAVPPAVVPAGAAAAPVANNPGFNAQTTVGNRTDSGVPTSLAGVVLLLTAGAIVALRRRQRAQGV